MYQMSKTPDSIIYPNLSNVLPPQRLLMYSKIFDTTDPIELHGAYIWSIKVSASILPLISILEIALRNSIHNNASKKIGLDWYDKLNTRMRSSWKDKQRDQKNIKWHFKQIADVKLKLVKKIPPKGLNKHDLLVAKMDFGFWDNLLRECFSKNGDSKALWPQCIPLVFPNLPSGYTNTLIQQEISEIRQMRNDIAHHAPIWKHSSVFDEQGAIYYLNSKINKIVEIISWLSQDKVDWIEIHMMQAEARRKVSLNYLQLCQRKNMNNCSIEFSKYKRNLRSNLKLLDRDKFNLFCTKDNKFYMLTKFSD
jgi:hypothetical protein